MYFSNNRKLSKLLSLILALILMASLFTGCMKKDSAEDTSEPDLNLNLSDTPEPTETQTEPTETTAPVVNENTATVTSQLNIRSSPSTEAVVVGTLYAGDKVEISRREEVTGIDWAYIISPEAGWIVMDYVEMDIPTADAPEDTSTPAGGTTPTETTGDSTSTQSIKGVITANGLNIRSEASTDGKVQGSYNKGDVVTILETKNGWGRTNKGWIKMQYVNTSGTTTDSTTTNNTTTNNTTNNTTVTGNGSTTVQLKGIVKVKELNIRASASTDGERLGSYTYGDRVEILEKSGSWGRTSKGWIHLDYIYQDGTTGTNTASGTVTGTQLNIRSGPGTGYGSVGSYNQGDSVSILEQFTYNGTTWGCTNKGWICMDYVDVGGTSNSSNTTTSGQRASVTANSLLIRSGAGTGYATVGSLDYGDNVTITETTTVDGVTWGKISTGWICMSYVELH
ncbi:MAG: SH3 domain-containing protein [Oscillospiraceae bacterium]|nr:SH3 domain-containing protein [Oscillospiraceae bacterium]